MADSKFLATVLLFYTALWWLVGCQGANMSYL